MQPRPTTHWPSILLAILSIMGILAMFSCGMFLLLRDALAIAQPALIPNTAASAGDDILLPGGLFLCVALLLPALYYSLRRLNGKPIPTVTIRPIRVWQAIVILAFWLSAILSGYMLETSLNAGWLMTTLLYLPAIALPVLTLAWIGLGGLPLGSRQRFWSTFGVGMLAGPGLAAMLEFLIYLGFVVLSLLLLAAHPEWMAAFNQIKSQLSSTQDLDTLLMVIAPYLMNPLVILLAIAVMSGLVPLIEELVKPIPVWLMAGRLHSPAQGFALGALSGAGFALVEGLVAASSVGEDWGALAVARAGGSLMHILTTGLMGWGIASAWQERRILRLLGLYGLSVLIHSAWNALTVMIVFGSLRVFLVRSTYSAGNQPDALGVLLSITGAVMLVILSALTLITLLLVNRKLRPPGRPCAAPTRSAG